VSLEAACECCVRELERNNQDEAFPFSSGRTGRIRFEKI
jgi:endogenous inhibitor of DNA gyrase (YacG/DUF329 family)